MYSVTQQSAFICVASPRHEITPQVGWMITMIFFFIIICRCLFGGSNKLGELRFVRLLHHHPYARKNNCMQQRSMLGGTSMPASSKNTCTGRTGLSVSWESWPPEVRQPESLNEIFNASASSAVRWSGQTERPPWCNASQSDWSWPSRVVRWPVLRRPFKVLSYPKALCCMLWSVIGSCCIFTKSFLPYSLWSKSW